MSTSIKSPSVTQRLIQQLQPPVVLSVISDTETPVSVFHKLSPTAKAGFLFESAQGDTRLARFSFVAVDPLFTVEFKSGTAIMNGAGNNQSESRTFSDPTLVLKDILDQCALVAGTGAAELDGLPFTGGLVGYMGYGATRYFENIAQQDQDLLGVPEGFYGLYDSLVVFDHQYRRLHIISRRGMEYARHLLQRINDGQPLLPLPATNLSFAGDVFAGVTTNMTADHFLNLVHRSKEYIAEGQVFQLVVSQRFSLQCQAAPLDVYRILQAINPSPYAYYLKLPGGDYIGSSPETFVRCIDGQMSLRAIAGTRPRGEDPAEDAALEAELKTNEKELAEHYMLVDLGRNDVGRVCQVGSIKLGEIASLTRYTHVMHLSTEISGQLRAGKTSFDAFKSCFPRGTVSGAPKVRAMQLLSGLETEQRGIYSGVVGYFDFQGNTDGAIAIRSALIKNGTAHINAGAGIVLDSDAQAEYEETRNKAKSVVKAVVAANLTMEIK